MYNEEIYLLKKDIEKLKEKLDNDKEFKNIIIKLGKKIKENVITFVEKNKSDDDKLYKYAILKLKDERIMKFSFEHNDNLSDIDIWNCSKNETSNRYEGDCLFITEDSYHGISIEIYLYNYDGRDLSFTISERNWKDKDIISTKDVIDIFCYMMNIYLHTFELEYDEKATKSISNFTEEAKIEYKREYNEKLFNNEINKLSETGSQSRILPSVETAVNYWLDLIKKMNDITSIDIDKLEKFKDLLSKEIMERLKQGVDNVCLSVDYNPQYLLGDVLSKTSISGIMLPKKTNMVVKIDSVEVTSEPEPLFQIVDNFYQEKKKIRGKN